MKHMAAGSLLAAFLFSGASGAAAQSCLQDSNGDGHPLFGSMIARGEVTYPVTSIASGDLNGDGHIDAVMTHQPAGSGYPGVISILLNEGDGMLESAPRIELAINAAPRSVQLGDLNGDGALDLVYVDESLDTVAVYLNNGAATFTLVGTYPTGDEPSSVQVADLDGDTENDLAVLARVSDDITVLRNDGAGVFTPDATRYAAGSVPTAPVCSNAANRHGPIMAAADFDEDGDWDLAVPNDGGFSIVRNTGSGTFLAPEFVFNPDATIVWAISAGDLNGDGWPDLAQAGQLSTHDCDTGAFVALNVTGEFPTQDRYDANWYDSVDPGFTYQLVRVAIGDIDGDQDPDLVLGHAYRMIQQMLFNDGSGNFAPVLPDLRWVAPDTSSDLGPLLLDDFDGDGRLDLAVAKRAGTGFLRVLLNEGTGTGHIFQQPQYVPDQTDIAVTRNIHPWYVPRAATIADIDRDGDADVIATDAGSDNESNTNEWPTHVNVMRNPGDGDFSAAPVDVYDLPHAVSDPGVSWYGRVETVRAGDLNADGWLDLVVADPGRSPEGNDRLAEGTSLWVLLNDQTGSFLTPLRYDTTDGDCFGTTDVALADVDGDDDLDAAIVNSSTLYLAGQGLELPETQTRFRIYRNDGTGALIGPESPIDLGYRFWGTMAEMWLNDLDHDGDVDAVVNTSGEGGVWVLHNNGSGVFTPDFPAITAYRVPITHALADLNGDGFKDIVIGWHPIYDPQAPAFAVYLNDEQGHYSELDRVDFNLGTRAYSLLGVDMNGDELDDLVGSSGATADVTVWINAGWPNLEMGHYACAWPLWSVAAGDLDGDDDPEVVAASTEGFRSNLSILENRRCSIVLPGDLDGSGCVDITDLAMLLSAFGCAADCGASDIDGSGSVDITDLATLLGNFGECL